MCAAAATARRARALNDRQIWKHRDNFKIWISLCLLLYRQGVSASFHFYRSSSHNIAPKRRPAQQLLVFGPILDIRKMKDSMRIQRPLGAGYMGSDDDGGERDSIPIIGNTKNPHVLPLPHHLSLPRKFTNALKVTPHFSPTNIHQILYFQSSRQINKRG